MFHPVHSSFAVANYTVLPINCAAHAPTFTAPHRVATLPFGRSPGRYKPNDFFRQSSACSLFYLLPFLSIDWAACGSAFCTPARIIDPSTHLDGLTWSPLRDDLSPRSGQKIQSVVKVYAFHNSAPHGTDLFPCTVHRVLDSRARMIWTREMKARSIILSLASYLPFYTFPSTFFWQSITVGLGVDCPRSASPDLPIEIDCPSLGPSSSGLFGGSRAARIF